MPDKRSTGRPRGRPRMRPTVKRNITVHADLDMMVDSMAQHMGIAYASVVNAILRAWYESEQGVIAFDPVPDANIKVALPLTWPKPSPSLETENTDDARPIHG